MEGREVGEGSECLEGRNGLAEVVVMDADVALAVFEQVYIDAFFILPSPVTDVFLLRLRLTFMHLCYPMFFFAEGTTQVEHRL